MLTKIDKALGAGISAGVLVFGTMAASGNHVDLLIEVVAAVASAVVTGVVTYFTPNKTA